LRHRGFDLSSESPLSVFSILDRTLDAGALGVFVTSAWQQRHRRVGHCLN
jgi:hypothetical protein